MCKENEHSFKVIITTNKIGKNFLVGATNYSRTYRVVIEEV